MYDLLGGSCAVANSMVNQRAGQTATLMQSGNILVTGGYVGNPSSGTPINTVEVLQSADRRVDDRERNERDTLKSYGDAFAQRQGAGGGRANQCHGFQY
jgi:hypothetical protein